MARCRAMGDARHKRKYPPGKREQMTARWKQQVRDRLAENSENDIYPRNQSELADAIGVHKTAITTMFRAQASKLVNEICRILKIGPPMAERVGDDLDDFIQKLSDEKRERALAILKLAGLG